MAELLTTAEMRKLLPRSSVFEEAVTTAILASELADRPLRRIGKGAVESASLLASQANSHLASEVEAANLTLTRKGVIGVHAKIETTEAYEKKEDGPLILHRPIRNWGLSAFHTTEGKLGGLAVLDTSAAEYPMRYLDERNGTEPDRLLVCAQFACFNGIRDYVSLVPLIRLDGPPDLSKTPAGFESVPEVFSVGPSQ